MILFRGPKHHCLSPLVINLAAKPFNYFGKLLHLDCVLCHLCLVHVLLCDSIDPHRLFIVIKFPSFLQKAVVVITDIEM